MLNRKIINILTYIFIVISSLFVGLRTYYTEPFTDDLVYRHVIDNGFLTNYNQIRKTTSFLSDTTKYDNKDILWYETKIQNMSDVFASQKTEYLNHSGRFIIHILVQMFSGIWGMTTFSICNGIVMGIVILLMLQFAGWSQSVYYKFLIAALIACFFNFIYPIRLLYFMNIAYYINYVWVLIPVFTTLYIWRRIIHLNNSFHSYKALLLLLSMGIFAGATQECFVLPICVGLGISLFLHLFILRNAQKSHIILYAGVILGALTLILSPGNFRRASTTIDVASITNINAGIYMIYENSMVRLFLILLVLIFIIPKLRKRVIRNISDIELDLTLWIGSVCCAIVLHPNYQSLSALYLFSFMLAIRCLLIILDKSPSLTIKNIVNIAAILLSIVFITYQVMIIKYSVKSKEYNHNLVEQYIQSADGVVIADDLFVPDMIKEYIVDFKKLQCDRWFPFCVEAAYGSRNKIFRIYSKADADSIQKYMHEQDTIIKLSNDVLLPLKYANTLKEIEFTENDNNSKTLIVDSLEVANTRWGRFRIVPNIIGSIENGDIGK